MNNKRIIGRATFRYKDTPHSAFVKNSCTQAIDGFRRKSDEFAGTKELCGFCNVKFAG
jgi:hypothetical protein